MPATPPAADAVPPPRPAATVLLLHEAAAGLQVLMLRRHAAAGFAADMWVFPGGIVDASDRTLPATCWTGITPDDLTGRFNAAPDLVLGFHVAAVREMFEEAGVLLASHGDGSPVDVSATDVRRLRDDLNAAGPAGAQRFTRWLHNDGVVLDLSLLTYLSRWVTPTAERRRYDTCFFVARAPAGQVAAHDRMETTDQRWITAADALEASQAGEMKLMFPTLCTLRLLASVDGVASLCQLAERQDRIPAVQPHLELDAEGRPLRLLHPDDPDYPAELYR